MLSLHVNPSSGVPIYRQIMDQVHSLGAGGTLKEGERLPSVRELAAFLQVNPMTVSKAYSLLEAEKTVYRLRGKGVFISSSVSILKKRERRAMLEQLAKQVALESQRLNISAEETINILKERLSIIQPKREGQE